MEDLWETVGKFPYLVGETPLQAMQSSWGGFSSDVADSWCLFLYLHDSLRSTSWAAASTCWASWSTVRCRTQWLCPGPSVLWYVERLGSTPTPGSYTVNAIVVHQQLLGWFSSPCKQQAAHRAHRELWLSSQETIKGCMSGFQTWPQKANFGTSKLTLGKWLFQPFREVFSLLQAWTRLGWTLSWMHCDRDTQDMSVFP